MKRIILNTFLLLSFIGTATSQSNFQGLTNSISELPSGVMNISNNTGTIINANTLKTQFINYPGNNQQIDIGNVVYFYGYNDNVKRYYDGLYGTGEDQETIDDGEILDAKGQLQFTSDGDVLTKKLLYTNKITLLGKLNILPGYTTLAIRYETADQINIFFYNYDANGILLSCFLAACNEKDQHDNYDTPSAHSVMTATINTDKTIQVFTDGDFMIDQKFQLLPDGHFKVVNEKVTEYNEEAPQPQAGSITFSNNSIFTNNGCILTSVGNKAELSLSLRRTDEPLYGSLKLIGNVSVNMRPQVVKKFFYDMAVRTFTFYLYPDGNLYCEYSGVDYGLTRGTPIDIPLFIYELN